MLGKVILWLSFLIFGGYGIACLVSPEYPAGLAGLSIANGDGFAEIGAMYGGLQAGFGILCLIGALREWMFRPALLMIAVMVGALAAARGFWWAAGADPVGGYTQAAFAFEVLTASLALFALKQASQ